MSGISRLLEGEEWRNWHPGERALSSYAQRHLENLAEEFLAKHVGLPMQWYLDQLGDA